VVNRVTCSALVPSSILYVHACHSRGALPAHWACRMLSGPWGIVVVHASWPGHPTIIKKKKNGVTLFGLTVPVAHKIRSNQLSRCPIGSSVRQN